MKWLVDFNAGKIQLVSFDWSNNTGAIHRKMDGFDLVSKLVWGSYIISIATSASNKIGALNHSMKFLSPEVSLYFYKSTTIHPCMEYCYHICAGLSPLVVTWYC